MKKGQSNLNDWDGCQTKMSDFIMEDEDDEDCSYEAVYYSMRVARQW